MTESIMEKLARIICFEQEGDETNWSRWVHIAERVDHILNENGTSRSDP